MKHRKPTHREYQYETTHCILTSRLCDSSFVPIENPPSPCRDRCSNCKLAYDRKNRGMKA